MVPRIIVDLNRPPAERWSGIAPFRDVARELLSFYLRDLGCLGAFEPLLAEYRDSFLAPEHVSELRGVARVIGATEEEVLVGNLYYDGLKLVLGTSLGCTAFAVDSPAGPLHARNLDWTTADGLLARETIIVDFVRDGEVLYTTVTWPGFVGCLSGVAPGRFAITLNAVLSDDPPALAPPIAFVLRDMLERATGFDDAVASLRNVEVASDSLLLVTGPRAGEMVVIERSPTRAALRSGFQGAVIVTNDYRALPAAQRGAANALTQTSCSRFDRAHHLLATNRPCDIEGCLAVLRDEQVRMGITVQHMVLSAASGAVSVMFPGPLVLSPHGWAAR